MTDAMEFISFIFIYLFCISISATFDRIKFMKYKQMFWIVVFSFTRNDLSFESDTSAEKLLFPYLTTRLTAAAVDAYSWSS